MVATASFGGGALVYLIDATAQCAEGSRNSSYFSEDSQLETPDAQGNFAVFKRQAGTAQSPGDRAGRQLVAVVLDFVRPAAAGRRGGYPARAGCVHNR